MDIHDRYSRVCETVAEACACAGRDPADVTLVAISKRQTETSVEALLKLGHLDLGENLVQAWRERAQRFTNTDIRWHLVGAVQTNKAKYIAASPPSLLHTVDRSSLVEALQRRIPRERPLKCLIQVNVDQEAQKAGCAPDELDRLADEVLASQSLQLCGLMCIPRPVDGQTPRAAFARTRQLLEQISDRLPRNAILSMGMSGDYEAAIAEGSTLVRVGTAIFGPREP
ncbi:MAG: YggS family pyridoxal phosphate-dependent enzyme [Myxococcota bacterium]|nr:YggS family pyridoxal phosphate-dependent enzyme [Myxococcota bacterium]